MKYNSLTAELIFNAKLILIDEVTMATNYVLDAINKCCQDIMGNDELFGAKVVLLSRDFRQCIPK